MKVLVQWAQAIPKDWQTVQSEDWNSLSSKGFSVSPVLDNRQGTIFSLNVQGVLFEGYDHQIVTNLPGGKIKVTVWRDESTPLTKDKLAQEWIFDPIAPDASLGGALNTKQTITIYSDTITGNAQNTTYKKWSDFTILTIDKKISGAKFPQVIADAHVSKQTEYGWRDWIEGLAPDEVDPKTGQIKSQKDLGRYSPSEHTLTFIQRSFNTSNGVHTGDFEKGMNFVTASSVGLLATIAAGIAKFTHIFTSGSGAESQPKMHLWPSGTYRAQLDCTNAGVSVEYGMGDSPSHPSNFPGHFARVDSSASSHQEGGQVQSETIFTGTGLKLGTVSWTPTAGSYTDRFAVAVMGAQPDLLGGNQRLNLRVNTSDSFVDAPFLDPADLFYVPTNQPYFDKKRNQYLYPTESFLDISPEFIPFFSPISMAVSYVRQTQYQGYFFVEFETLPPEVVNLDKWLSSYPNLIFDRRRQQFSYPIYFAETDLSELITMDKWYVEHFNQAIRKKARPEFYPTFFYDQSPFFVRSRGFIRGLNKDTNTGIGTRGHPIIGINTDKGIKTV